MEYEYKITMLCNSLKSKLKEACITIEVDPIKFDYVLFVHFTRFNVNLKYTLHYDIFDRRTFEQVKFDLLKFIQEDIVGYFVKPWYECEKGVNNE